MTQPTEKPKQSPRITAAYFVESVRFGGEEMGVQVGRNVDSIEPARLEADGVPVAIDKGQRADGVAIRFKYHDRQRNSESNRLSFVTWANIRSIQYSES